MHHWNPLLQVRAQPGYAGSSPTAPVSNQPPGQLALYQAQVAAAINTMAPMPTMAERARYKQRHALPEIERFVEGYVQSGAHYQNSVAVMAVVWRFDIGDIEGALKLGLYLVDQGCQRMSAKFGRDLPTFICDCVYDWANEQLKANAPAAPYLGQLLGEIQGNSWQLHPAVHSKLLAMAAKHALRDTDYSTCVDLCDAAQAVNPEGAGVKTLRAQAAKLAVAPGAAESARFVFYVSDQFALQAPTQGGNGSAAA
jgi:hypothetical protein